MSKNLTNKERKRIRKDIINHQIESVVVGDGDDITDERINEIESTLNTVDDEELLQWWDSVGEWVASRGFEPDEQLEKLRNTGITDYGYIEYKYAQPY